jgi:hypothetical protein
VKAALVELAALHSPYRMLAGENYPIGKVGFWAEICTLPMFDLEQRVGRDQKGRRGRGTAVQKRSCARDGHGLLAVTGGRVTLVHRLRVQRWRSAGDGDEAEVSAA